MKPFSMIFLILLGVGVSLAANPPNPSPASEIQALQQRVTLLENKVQEMDLLLEPLRKQQQIQQRRETLRTKFEEKIAIDRKKYKDAELREAETLYQVANKNWKSPEAKKSLEEMIQKYPDINRTGCAVLYLAQSSEGDEKVKYLQMAIDKFNDCYYGDGVQVGAYARYLLGWHYQNTGNNTKANTLFYELKTQFSNSVDHSGNFLMDKIPQ